MSRRFCFTLDLKGEPAPIDEYRKYHEKNPKMQDWEQLMRRFQQSIAGSEAWRKVAAHGTYFRARTLAGEAHQAGVEGVKHYETN